MNACDEQRPTKAEALRRLAEVKLVHSKRQRYCLHAWLQARSHRARRRSRGLLLRRDLKLLLTQVA
jgi:hypothetical protein